MATFAMENNLGPEARAFAQPIVAEQSREMSLLRHWWRSWFDEEMPLKPSHESAEIAGMPSDIDMKRLQASSGENMHRTFLTMMGTHHRSAITMTDDALEHAGDPHLRTFAYSVRHAQSGQVRWIDALLTVQGPGLPRRPSV